MRELNGVGCNFVIIFNAIKQSRGYASLKNHNRRNKDDMQTMISGKQQLHLTEEKGNIKIIHGRKRV